MSRPDHGGAAFPIPAVFEGGQAVHHFEFGMSRRQWYAGMALPLVDPKECARIAGQTEGVSSMEEVIAHYAYRVADALIAHEERAAATGNAR